jgi:[ribosomal protein S5]-alanine N-acetyltransferase
MAQPPPSLVTARLRLRPVRPSMAAELHTLLGYPEVRRHLMKGGELTLGWVDQEIRESMARFQARKPGIWVLQPLEGGAPIGLGGFREFHDPPEFQLVLALAPTFWHQGLATEAGRALVTAGFGWGRLRRIVAEAHPSDPRALRFLERLGMRRSRSRRKGGDPEVARFVLTRKEARAADGEQATRH